MYYSDGIIEEVRMRNPIVDVIGSYVHLTKKGGGYFGLCPFHNEKSPSFHVLPQRQMYHCFGCGVGGNVFSFIMEYENVSFPEAMQILAKRAGIELPQQEVTPGMRAEHDRRAALLEIQKQAAIYYCRMLRTEAGEAGLNYLKNRGLSDETIRAFGLGFATAHSGDLYRYLKSRDYSDDILKDSGLVTLSERGAHDKFWNRVMFPIMDANNRVIGFGGRVMGTGEPKYLNSPETKIFDKSRNLYGLNVARRTREGFFLVCEGYMDVISMHQAGFTNAVASLGTAFTAQHGMILKRYTEEVILCYDSDEAGRKAALRAIPILSEAGLRIRVLNLSPHKDPDEFIKALGADAFRERIRQAENAFLFEIRMMRDKYDFSDPGEKGRFFNACAERIAGFDTPIERRSYAETIAETYGTDLQDLMAQISAVGNRIGFEKKPAESAQEERYDRPLPTVKKRESGIIEAEKAVLSTLVLHPEFYRSIMTLLSPEDFEGEIYREVAGILFEKLAEGHKTFSDILDRFIDDDEKRNEAAKMLSTEIAEDLSEAEEKQAFTEAVLRIRGDVLERKYQETLDPMELMRIIEEKNKLKDLKIDL